MTTKKIVEELMKTLEEKKAEKIVAIDVSNRTPFAEYYILANGMNSRHLNALKEAVLEKIQELKIDFSHVEGTQDSGWMLIDTFSVIINVFSEEQRNRFDLDSFLTK